MSNRIKWAVVVLIMVAHLLMLWALVPLLGPTVNVLLIAAPLAAAMFFGFRRGLFILLLSWGLSFLVMYSLPALEGSSERPMRAIPPFFASIVFVFGASRIHSYIKQRRIAEEALRESEQRYRLVFEQSGEGILLMDANGIVLDASPRIAEQVNVTPEDAIGRPLLDVLSFREDKPDSFLSLIRDANAALYERELVLNDTTGEKRYVQLSFSSANAGEGNAKWICLVRNVTEKHEMMEMLQESRKMEAIGRLAGGVAHDLNNILNAIVGSAHAHRNEHVGCDMSFEDIDNISAACQRGARLTQSLLGFTRKSNVRRELFSLNQSIQNILSVTGRTSMRHIDFESRLEPNLPHIEGDQQQIETALMNICLNAHDAMPDGGTLTVTSYSDAEGVWAHFKDTGTGMDEDVRQRAFEPFFTTRPVGKGTGLGLAMAYGVMQSHNGRIHLKSARGNGTTVTLWFPRAQVNIKVRKFDAAQPLDMDLSILANHTVLLVDDEPLVLRAGIRMLKTLGCKVLGANGGEDAIARVRENSDISLVLLDLIMPGMDGSETLARLREIRPEMPVILVSGYTRNVERVDVLQQERECEFIPKPYSPADLVTALEKMNMK